MLILPLAHQSTQCTHHTKVMCHWTPARSWVVGSFVPRAIKNSCKLGLLLITYLGDLWGLTDRIMVLFYRWQNWSPGRWVQRLLCIRHFEWINEILGVPSILVLSPCIRTIKSSFAWRSWWQEGSWVCLDHVQNAHKLFFHSLKTFMKQKFYLLYQSPWTTIWENARTHCPLTDHEPVSQPQKPLAHLIILINVGHKNWRETSNVTFPSFFLWP